VTNLDEFIEAEMRV